MSDDSGDPVEVEMPFEICLGRLRILPYQEWGEWRGDWNWRTFTFIKLDMEYADYKYTFEVNIGLLGLVCCIEWYWGERRAAK